MSSVLGRIIKGRIKRPPRIIVAGVAGVGKSTFASRFPAPLFLDAERRTEHLDVSRVEIESWPEVLQAMAEVYKAAADCEPPCKTLVVDTIDRCELLLHQHICEREGVKSIEDYGGGYGKGYTAALNEWQRFINGCEKLRSVGVSVLMVAHTHVKTVKNPVGADYDRWQMKMNNKAADLLRESADAVGFAHFELYVNKENVKDKKGKAVGGDRVLSFAPSPAWETKQGLNLPDQIPLEYEALAAALEG